MAGLPHCTIPGGSVNVLAQVNSTHWNSAVHSLHSSKGQPHNLALSKMTSDIVFGKAGNKAM